MRAIGASALVGGILLALAVSACVGEREEAQPQEDDSPTVSRAEYAAAACLAFDAARIITDADLRRMSGFTDAELRRMSDTERRELLMAMYNIRALARAHRARDVLEGLPGPPAVYRDVHDALVQLLEVVGDERDEDEDLLRATLAGQIATLEDDDRAIFNAACGALP